jgi:hypothetical protein
MGWTMDTTDTQLRELEHSLAVALRDNATSDIARLESSISSHTEAIARQSKAEHDQAEREAAEKEASTKRARLLAIATTQRELATAESELLKACAALLRHKAHVDELYAAYVNARRSGPVHASETIHTAARKLREAGVWVDTAAYEAVADSTQGNKSSVADLRKLADGHERRASTVQEPPYELVEVGLQVKELVRKADDVERSLAFTETHAPTQNSQAYNARLAEYTATLASLREQQRSIHGELRVARERFSALSASLVPQVEKVSVPSAPIAEKYDRVFDGVSHRA